MPQRANTIFWPKVSQKSWQVWGVKNGDFGASCPCHRHLPVFCRESSTRRQVAGISGYEIYSSEGTNEATGGGPWSPFLSPTVPFRARAMGTVPTTQKDLWLRGPDPVLVVGGGRGGGGATYMTQNDPPPCADHFDCTFGGNFSKEKKLSSAPKSFSCDNIPVTQAPNPDPPHSHPLQKARPSPPPLLPASANPSPPSNS